MKMKTYLKNILIFTLLLGSSSCEDFLDRAPDVETISGEEVFSTYYGLRRYAENMYNFIYHNGATENAGNPKNYTNPLVFSDECIASYPRRQYDEANIGNYWYYIDQGSGNGRYEFTIAFEYGFQCIRIANVTIEQIDTPTDITQEQKDQLLGQCYFMRAMSYFEVLKRYGGMPYFRESLSLDEYLGFDRLSYYETALNIAEDCDLAFEKLPDVWDSNNTGRPIKAAALALKSRALLYAASQTVNTENDLSKWEDAAVAANDFIEYIESGASYHEMIDASEAIEIDVSSINGADYKKASPEKLESYREIFMDTVLNEEIIFSFYRQKNDPWQNTIPGRTFMTAEYARSKPCMGASPTQDVVDWYETQNGLFAEDDPSYDPQNPYINRDPRFYNNILYNGVHWPNGETGDTIELYYLDAAGGQTAKDRCYDRNALPQSLTGYIARKYWPEGISSKQAAGDVDCIVPAVWFRVSEAYLNYAEAAYEASGRSNIDAQYPASAGYTAKSAINKIRNRVGMPDVNALYLNNPDFIQKIRNERAVEMCFEDGHRWWDIRRWHIAHEEEVRTIHTMNLTGTNDLATYPTGFIFSVEQYETVKVFEERHYFYPLKPEDVAIHDEFDQNPGW